MTEKMVLRIPPNLQQMSLQDAEKWLSSLSSQELLQLQDLADEYLWLPNPGPQTDAYLSEADVLFYGGAAGGGKSDLLLGCATTAQHESIIYRREFAQLRGLEERLLRLIPRKSYNMQYKVAKLPGDITLEFGGCQRIGDEQKYQGRPHDFIGFDEITHFLESQFVFLRGWLRSVRPEQHCRVVAAGNPPTSQDGAWIIDYFRPWLDASYPAPAAPGELRYFWRDPDTSKDFEVEKGYHKVVNNILYEAESRTFIPARLNDNPYLRDTKYGSNLNMMPEPLRSQLLFGDFNLRVDDDPWQLIPTDWLIKAQARWSEGLVTNLSVEQIGADIARGGTDDTVLVRRFQNIVFPAIVVPGRKTPDGGSAATLILQAIPQGEEPLVAVDVIGVGTSVVDHLKGVIKRLVQFNGAGKCIYLDKTKKFKFVNMRAYGYWLVREALDPEGPNPLALPQDGRMLADLTALRWKLTPAGIQVESKDDVKKRIGRSPDRGDALMYALVPGADAGIGMLDWMRSLAAAEAAKKASIAAEEATHAKVTDITVGRPLKP